MDYIHSRAISASATEGWIFTFPPKAALELCTLCILPQISSPLDWVQCSLRLFPTDKVRTILCKFALFVHPKLCSVKQSKQSKFKTCCILNLNRPKNYAFLCANYAAVSFWSMAELMMRSFRIQKGLSLFSVEHHYLPTRNLKAILALNCVKFSAVWEKFFRKLCREEGSHNWCFAGTIKSPFPVRREMDVYIFTLNPPPETSQKLLPLDFCKLIKLL